MGCSRVVTAREMSLEEIRRIHDETDIEIESFVHGALLLLLFRTMSYEQPYRRQKRKQGTLRQPCRLPIQCMSLEI